MMLIIIEENNNAIFSIMIQSSRLYNFFPCLHYMFTLMLKLFKIKFLVEGQTQILN